MASIVMMSSVHPKTLTKKRAKAIFGRMSELALQLARLKSTSAKKMAYTTAAMPRRTTRKFMVLLDGVRNVDARYDSERPPIIFNRVYDDKVFSDDFPRVALKNESHRLLPEEEVLNFLCGTFFKEFCLPVSVLRRGSGVVSGFFKKKNRILAPNALYIFEGKTLTKDIWKKEPQKLLKGRERQLCRL